MLLSETYFDPSRLVGMFYLPLLFKCVLCLLSRPWYPFLLPLSKLLEGSDCVGFCQSLQQVAACRCSHSGPRTCRGWRAGGGRNDGLPQRLLPQPAQCNQMKTEAAGAGGEDQIPWRVGKDSWNCSEAKACGLLGATWHSVSHQHPEIPFNRPDPILKSIIQSVICIKY